MSMSVECGVYPVSGAGLREVGADLHVQSQTVNYNRAPLPQTVSYQYEPPPPYTESVGAPAVVSQPTAPLAVIVQPPLGNRPMLYTCPQCNARVITKVKHVSSQRTHVAAGFTCGLFSWCLLCCLAAIPYMITAFKIAEHYCPNCKMYLGKSSVSKW